MITQQETGNFANMLKWAMDSKFIESMAVKVKDSRFTIHAYFYNKQVIEASGDTLTEAMNNWSNISVRVQAIADELKK